MSSSIPAINPSTSGMIPFRFHSDEDIRYDIKMSTEIVKATRGERRRQETRAKLLDAAYELIANQGLDSTTIQQITETADVGFGSFYNHFDSKQVIFEAVVEEKIDAFGEVLARIREKVSDPAEVLSSSIRLTIRNSVKDQNWGWFLIRSAFSIEPLRAGLGMRMARDIAMGLESKRFAASSAEAAVVAVGGIVLATIAASLAGNLGKQSPEGAAAIALQSLGLPTKEAEEIAHRALPRVF